MPYPRSVTDLTRENTNLEMWVQLPPGMLNNIDKNRHNAPYIHNDKWRFNMPKPRWTKEELVEIVKTARSISDILKHFGLYPATSNYRTFYKYIGEWNIDISHINGKNVSKEILLKNKKPPRPLSEILKKQALMLLKEIPAIASLKTFEMLPNPIV